MSSSSRSITVFVVLAAGILFVKATNLKCYCNDSADCNKKGSDTCSAGYACYAEMLNNTAKYGCMQRPGHTSLCVRQGLPDPRDDQQFLLLCCYEDFCNKPITADDKYYKLKLNPTIHAKKPKQKNKISIPETFARLGTVSVKILSIIAAGGLFILILVVACAVHLLCYEKRPKNKQIDLSAKHSKDFNQTSPV